MIPTSTLNDNEAFELKEEYVINCIKSYRYNAHKIECIQKELESIAFELSNASVHTGIIKISKNTNRRMTQWENELLTKESILVAEQDRFIDANNQVDSWINQIRDPQHRKIIIEYLIVNRGSNGEVVAMDNNTTQGNVSKITKRMVENIARKIY